MSSIRSYQRERKMDFFKFINKRIDALKVLKIQYDRTKHRSEHQNAL